jgi:hypothetical protein
MGKKQIGSRWVSDSVSIALNGTYSEEIDIRKYTLLAVKTPASQDGTRLCAQGREGPDGTWADIDVDIAAYDVTSKASTWIPFWDSTSVGIGALPFIRFYFDDGAGTPETQTGVVTLIYVVKNVS